MSKIKKSYLGSELTDGKLTKLVISRKLWGSHYLFNSGNHDNQNSGIKGYCCLGFTARACGAKRSQLMDVSDMPVQMQHIKWPDWMLKDTVDAASLAETNDSSMPWPQKEKRIAKIFRKHGCTVVFVP